MKTIIANWKANPATLAEAQELFSAEVEAAEKYSSVRTVICPPFVFLEELSKQLATSNQQLATSLGAQDIFWEKSGPYTGEISPEMLKNFGVSHVLVGHSDRRYLLGERDEIINKKIKAALTAGIAPVLLVGEKEKDDIRQDVLIDQLSRDLEGLNSEQISKVLITYEPVWAISTHVGAEADTPENALEAISIVRSLLNSKFQIPNASFLYGGSVSEKNVADFLKHPQISGAVVGGASLRPAEFTKILEITSQISD